jgi:hypothetical protein
MAGDGRAADRTLIAGRRHDNDPATQSEIECFLKTAPASRRWALQRHAQIDDPRPGLDDGDDRIGEIFGGGTGHLFAIGGRLRENRSNQKAAPRADRGSHGHAPREKDPGDECSMRACCVAGIAARSRQFARDFADVFGGEIGMIERDRSVDQPDRNFEPAARPRHQGGKPDQA